MKRDPVLFRPIPDDEGLPPTCGFSMYNLLRQDEDHADTPIAFERSLDFNRHEETPAFGPNTVAQSPSDDCSEP